MRKENKNYGKTENIRNCGVCTCIHCLSNTCTLDECDMFERKTIQEG